MEKTGAKPTKSKIRRLNLIQWFNDMCKDCRYRFPSYIYEFHHRDPKTKEFNLGGNELNRKWEKVVIEASKCDMLCANCHKRRHHESQEDGE